VPRATPRRCPNPGTVLRARAHRQSLERDAFVDYYENHHIPLIRSLAPPPVVYRRHYLVRDELRVGDVDFDVVTELGFPDRTAYLAWRTAVGSGAAGERVAADEARFLDRARTRATVVEHRQ
jgi:hypothetical protein